MPLAKTIKKTRKNGARAEIKLAPAVEPAVNIDFPKQNEAITSCNYTFRISANIADAIPEVSFDGKIWQSCRNGCGYWWFDWNCEKGKHKIEARAQTRDGKTITSKKRVFKVEK